jgi:transcriptional regulator with PAS, ATPase and Fis domain
MAALTVTLQRLDGRDALCVRGGRACVSSPNGVRKDVALKLAPVIVGSGPCDLSIDDRSVSRTHCSLTLTTEGVVLRDLDSKNGTFLGNTRVMTILLEPGVRVRLGDSQLWVEGGEELILPLHREPTFGEVLGATPIMRVLFAELSRAAPLNESIVIQGESGTGKELLARAVHAQSQRRNGPFVVVDCAALSPSLAEAELFGAEEGAFTGQTRARVGLMEQAHGGTLFLDEVGELPLELQPRFLRALEAKEVQPLGGGSPRRADMRVIAATHRNLHSQVATGAFRKDLYYRLAVLEVRVPPLRERLEDLELLVEHFLKEQVPPRSLRDLPAGVLELFRSHAWPGNVRELRNAVVRLLVGAEVGTQLLQSVEGEKVGDAAFRGLTLRDARNAVLSSFERRYVMQMLEAHRGNVTAAARAMGVSRQIVHRLMARHQLRGDHGD